MIQECPQLEALSLQSQVMDSYSIWRGRTGKSEGCPDSKNRYEETKKSLKLKSH